MSDALAVVPAPEVRGGAGWSAASPTDRLLVWAAYFARFFPFPSTPPAAPPTDLLKPAMRSKIEAAGGGTWVKSSYPAALHLLPGQLATIVVILNGKILEEHFISSLNFSWPRVASCAAECVTQGSKVVFASFRDSTNQVQKFAMRFPTSAEAQTFLEAVMESSKGPSEIEFARNDFGSEICSRSSEHMMINTQQRWNGRTDDVSSLGIQNAFGEPLMADPYDREDSMTRSLRSFKDTKVGTHSSTPLPPSFSDFLTECEQETDAGLRNLKRDFESVKMQKQMVEYEGDYIKKQKHSIDEGDLVSEIQRYVSDAAFADMLFRVERVVDELATDLGF